MRNVLSNSSRKKTGGLGRKKQKGGKVTDEGAGNEPPFSWEPDSQRASYASQIRTTENWQGIEWGGGGGGGGGGVGGGGWGWCNNRG